MNPRRVYHQLYYVANADRCRERARTYKRHRTTAKWCRWLLEEVRAS